VTALLIQQVLALAFSRDGKELLAGGDRYFTVFSAAAAGAMTARRGLFGSTAKVQRVLSAVALSATSGFVMGGSTGALLRLENGSRKVKEHYTALYTTCHYIVLPKYQPLRSI
jgi:hypothetical protein